MIGEDRWAKTVQLGLEAKGIVIRGFTSHCRVAQVPLHDLNRS
jgi:hypothetical protein